MTTPSVPTHAVLASGPLPEFGGDPIADLEALLEAEQRFLSRLDADGIEAVAKRKEELLPLLADARAQGVDLERLTRVRELAVRNQLLMVHARETVGTIVTTARTGRGPTGSARPPVPAGPGGRVSVKV